MDCRECPGNAAVTVQDPGRDCEYRAVDEGRGRTGLGTGHVGHHGAFLFGKESLTESLISYSGRGGRSSAEEGQVRDWNHGMGSEQPTPLQAHPLKVIAHLRRGHERFRTAPA